MSNLNPGKAVRSNDTPTKIIKRFATFIYNNYNKYLLDRDGTFPEDLKTEVKMSVIMKTMCTPGYHHNGFVATHALGHMTIISTELTSRKRY